MSGSVGHEKHDPQNMVGGMAIVMAGTAIGLGVNYCYGIALARVLGPEQFGLYSLGLAVFNVLAVISVLGMDNAMLRFIPGASAGKAAKLVARTTITWGTSVGILLCLAALSGSTVLAEVAYGKPDVAPVLTGFALGIPVYAFSMICLSGMQALHDVRNRIAIKYVIEPLVKVVLTAILIVLGFGLWGVIAAFVLSMIGSALLAWRGLSRQMGRLTENATAEFKRIDLLRYSSPLALSVALSMLATKSDVLAIGYFEEAAQVGLYGAAFLTAGMMGVALMAIESIISPLFSENIAGNNQERLLMLYRLGLRWAVIAACPILVLFLSAPIQIMSLFGTEFADAAICLVILAVAQFINCATGSANSILLMAGRSRSVLYIAIINGIALVGLNLLLVGKFGINGAAAAVALAGLLSNVIRLWVVHRAFGIHPYDLSLMRPVVMAAISFALITFLQHVTSPQNNTYILLVAMIMYGVMVLQHGLTEEDKLAMKSVYNKIRWRKAAGV